MKYRPRLHTLPAMSGLPRYGPPRAGWRRDDPATGAPHPTGPPAPPAADPAKPADPAADPGKKPKVDGDFDPDRAMADLGKAREDAKRERELRTKAEQDAKDRLDAVLIAIGAKPDPNTDPAATAAKIAKELTDAQTANRELRAENALYKHGAKLGADVASLQDSRTFMKSVEELDPDAADYDKAVAGLVKQAVKDNPKFAVASGTPGGQGPARQGTDTTGGGNGRQRPGSLGQAIAARMASN